ncbi:hypothetical protein Tco_0444938 [Tanacetum coccineum]
MRVGNSNKRDRDGKLDSERATRVNGEQGSVMTRGLDQRFTGRLGLTARVRVMRSEVSTETLPSHLFCTPVESLISVCYLATGDGFSYDSVIRLARLHGTITGILYIDDRTVFDCNLGNVRQPEFVYHGSSPLKSVKLISAMKARTLISHGCQGFLASVMDTSLEGPNIENLSVVREFADVFPDELPGLPPARRDLILA